MSNHSENTSKDCARKMPWLVSYRDFYRYLYRALHACKQGRVVFFCHRQKMFALAPYPDRGALARARRSFEAGEVISVRLEDQPSLR